MRVPYPDDGRPFGDGVFPTASGKVELFSDRLAAIGPARAADVHAGHRIAGRRPASSRNVSRSRC